MIKREENRSPSRDSAAEHGDLATMNKRVHALLVAALVAAFGVGIAACSEPDPDPPDYDECWSGWMRVPAGPFQFGMNPDDPFDGIDCGPEGPHSLRYTVTLSEFCMQQTEVPVSSYRACVQAGVCSLPVTAAENSGCNYTPEPGDRESHPINCVSWSAAREYCQKWENGDLPSEAQWEKAARGTDLRIFPWGNEPVTCDRANYDVNGTYYPDTGEGSGTGCFSKIPGTWEVGHVTSTKGDSPYGLKDMVGNVAEFTLDCMDRAFYLECSDGHCVDPVNQCDDPNNKVVRGGGAPSRILGSYVGLCLFDRASGTEDPASGAGFRCVKSPDRRSRLFGWF